MIFFYFILYIKFAFSALVPYPIPDANLPSGISLDVDLTDKKILITGGLHGIANATGWEFYDRNADVTITTRDLNNEYNGPFDLMEFEYGPANNRIQKFVKSYLRKNGGIDALVDIGLTAFTGLWLDFTPEEMEFATRMYLTDRLSLYREFFKYNNVSRPFNISIAMSTVAYGAGSNYFPLYTAGKKALKMFIKDFNLYEGPKYYPNVRFTSVSCSYVNTRVMLDGYNPSANRGDPFSIRFVEVATYLTAQGLSPVVVALAHLEAITKLTSENNTHYIVPTSPTGRIQSEIFYNIEVNDNTTQYQKDTITLYTAAGMNMTAYL